MAIIFSPNCIYIFLLQCDIVPNADRPNTYSCAYVPMQAGEYRVIIKFATKEIMNSPFKVMVEGAADPSKVTASGPGIEPQGNQVGRRTFFNIFTTGMTTKSLKIPFILFNLH